MLSFEQLLECHKPTIESSLNNFGIEDEWTLETEIQTRNIPEDALTFAVHDIHSNDLALTIIIKNFLLQ